MCYALLLSLTCTKNHLDIFIFKYKNAFLIKSLKSELFQFEKSDQNSENVLHICMCISSMCNNINLKYYI